jgi:plastocyanin
LRVRRALLIATCLGGGLAGAPATAGADERIVAAPVNQYATPTVTIDQGEPLFFRNLDLSQHDVVAHQNGPGGKPLFKSPLIGAGAEAAVEGAQALTTGRYEFFCSIHPFMHGTVNVTTAGAPQPGGGGQGPALQVRILDSSASRVKRAGKIRVRAETNEAARIELTATTERRRRPVTVARGRHEFEGARAATLTLRLTRSGRRAIRRGGTLKVSGVARDREGNQGSATTQRRLRR